MPRSLGGNSQHALMFGARASLPARADAPMLGQITTQGLVVFVINLFLFYAECADATTTGTPVSLLILNHIKLLEWVGSLSLNRAIHRDIFQQAISLG
jgi:hypothetical protein